MWISIVAGLLYMAVGISCVLWARRIQRYFSSYCHNAKRFIPFAGFIDSRAYIIMVRIIGVFLICTGLFVCCCEIRLFS